jgi:hypothetical protein
MAKRVAFITGVTGHIWPSSSLLKSPSFCSRSQTESPHNFCVLPLSDEFGERIAFCGSHEKFGSVWRSAFATTNSEGGMPGRMVRSQGSNESQTRLGSNDGKTLEQSLG